MSGFVHVYDVDVRVGNTKIRRRQGWKQEKSRKVWVLVMHRVWVLVRVRVRVRVRVMVMVMVMVRVRVRGWG